MFKITEKITLTILLLLAPCAMRAQVGPGVVPWLSSTPPTFCPGATPLYVIGIGFTGQGTVYGNSGTGTGCAVVGGGGTGGGTVTSVGLTMPGVLFNSSVPGSPVTSAGTLAPTLTTQSANTVLAGPSSGSAATPTFRSLVAADVPPVTNLAGGALGSIPYQSAAGTTAFLAGNTAANDKVLVSHGIGSVANAPTLSNAPALSAANMTNLPSVQFYDHGGVSVSATTKLFQQNQITGVSFALPAAVQANAITLQVITADNTSNLYDIGIYNLAGTLLADTGAFAGSAHFGTATSTVSLTFTTGVLLPAGTYMYAETTNCASSCAGLANWGGGTMAYGFFTAAGGSTTSGVLPGTITAPGTSWAGGYTSNAWAFILHN